ncbi:MAG: hypothetical protein EAZ59_05560 [Oscillatoriales cyanobacterium]|nr:MAG: hypothetical protein EAZ59_05560 [Oscillatoriales cyanobacterium]
MVLYFKFRGKYYSSSKGDRSSVTAPLGNYERVARNRVFLKKLRHSTQKIIKTRFLWSEMMHNYFLDVIRK